MNERAVARLTSWRKPDELALLDYGRALSIRRRPMHIPRAQTFNQDASHTVDNLRRRHNVLGADVFGPIPVRQVSLLLRMLSLIRYVLLTVHVPA